jgi:hypothetical protein
VVWIKRVSFIRAVRMDRTIGSPESERLHFSIG